MRTGGMAALILALPLIAVWAPARAQETGSLIKQRSAEISDEGKVPARIVLQQFARCVVVKYRKRVDEILNLPLGSADYIPLLNKALSSNCLSNGDLRMPRPNIRGALFEAAYMADFGDRPIVFSDGQSTGFAARNAAAEGWQTAVALEQFGECVSLGHSPQVRELLASYPGSAREAAAIQALRPAMSACVPKGQNFSFSPTVLRGGLAEGLYWLSKAALSSKPAQ